MPVYVQPGQQKRTTVVIVEDELLVRIAGIGTRSAGYHVIEARNADVALKVLERRSDEVAAILTDVNLSGSMDGFELARHIHEHWPHIRIAITSGYVRVQPGDIPGGGRFLPKPYRGAAVVECISDLLRSGRAAQTPARRSARSRSTRVCRAGRRARSGRTPYRNPRLNAAPDRIRPEKDGAASPRFHGRLTTTNSDARMQRRKDGVPLTAGASPAI